ncbi:unnamed protein product, partial [Heligmosomoides polygyrus]|uniref:Non-specific serine/threonine protein kinase n=1 Tax=Heligmosomoides polygyrus TaxID=6339 RepID=A0A183GKU8_HELPZ
MGIKCPAPGIRGRAADVVQKDVLQMSSNVRLGSEYVQKTSFNVRWDSNDVLQMPFKVRRDSEDVPQTSNLLAHCLKRQGTEVTSVEVDDVSDEAVSGADGEAGGPVDDVLVVVR